MAEIENHVDLFEAMPQGVIYFDKNGKTISVNQAAEDILGVSCNEMIGLFANNPKWKTIHIDGLKFESKMDPSILALTTGKKISNTIIGIYNSKIEEYKWLNINAIPQFLTNENKPYQVFTVFDDITEQINAKKIFSENQHKLEEMNQMFQLVIETIPSRIFWKDRNAKYLGCNTIFAQDAGCQSPSEMIGKDDYQFAWKAQADLYQKDDFEIINSGISKIGYVEPQNQAGDKFIWTFTTKVPLLNSDKEIIGVLGTYHDISDTKRTDDKLRLTNDELIKAKEKAEESDRLKSAFLANLSHEIRTPMNAILGFADLLRDNDLSQNDRDDFINIIHTSGNYLMAIISDIVEISKIDSGLVKLQYSQIHLRSFIDDLYRTLKPTYVKDKNIDFKINCLNPNDDTEITTDYVKLQQILTNLITNAIKFTNEGMVSFGYEVVDNEEIQFTVIDTGIGINEQDHHAIFERFRRVEDDTNILKGGSGLGLAISKAYVEMLGGSIQLVSEIGVGSIFSFTIPLIKVDSNCKKIVSKKKQHIHDPTKDGLILIVEDDNYNYLLFKELMSRTNYKIIRANNGKEAVRLCTENNNISLVLMDIKMPIMNGYTAFKKIKEIRTALPIIAQTAYVLPEDKEKIKATGFNGYIEKPIQRTQLMDLIKQSLLI